MLLRSALFFWILHIGTCKDILACEYLTEASNIRPIKALDPFLCTHIVFSSVTVDQDTYQVKLRNEKEDPPILIGLTSLRPKNTDLKLLISLSGVNHDSEAFKKAVSSKQNRKILIGSIIDLLTDYDFDGIDISFDLSDSDYWEHFESFLNELRVAVKEVKLMSISPGWLNFISTKVDISKLTKILDLVFLRSYGYHYKHENTTALSHALYSFDPEEYSLNRTVTEWLTKGFDRNKLVIGVDLECPQYHLTNLSQTHPGSPARYEKTLTLHSVCDEISVQSRYTVECNYEPLQSASYCVKYTTWISTETNKSVKDKANYVMSERLAGLVVWNFMYDIYETSCIIGYDLTNEIKTTFQNRGEDISKTN